MSDTPQVPALLREWMEVFFHRSLRDVWRFVRASGISMPQFNLLMHLHHHGRCGMSDLSERMDLSPAGISQLTDRLVQSGLLLRTEDPSDRRARTLALTEAGRALAEAGLRERTRWIEDLEAGLSADERALVLRALPVLVAAARSLDRSDEPA